MAGFDLRGTAIPVDTGTSSFTQPEVNEAKVWVVVTASRRAAKEAAIARRVSMVDANGNAARDVLWLWLAFFCSNTWNRILF